MPIDFTPLEEGGDGIQFMAFEEEPKPTVKPGDVEGRKRQVAAQIQAEEPRQVRERLGGQDTSSITGFLGDMFPTQAKEVFGGVVDTARAGADLVKGGLFQGPPTSIPALLEDPRTRAALGVARTIGAPFAPVANAITVGAEKANEALSALGLNKTADVVAGVGEAVANVYGVSKLGQKMNAAKAKAAARFPSIRSQAEARKVAGEAEIATATQEGEKQVAQAKQLLKAQREEAQQQAVKAGQEKITLESARQAEEESILSFAEAQKKTIPSGVQVREKLSKNAPFTKDVGKSFKATYETKQTAVKDIADEKYNTLRQRGAATPGIRQGYDEAIDEVLGEKGISRPFPTSAERAASGAKKGVAELDDDAVAEQIDSLQKAVSDAPSREAKAMAEDALTEAIGANRLPPNPTVADLVSEHKRLNAALGASRNDNLSRQLNILKKGVEVDIKNSSEDLFTKLKDADSFYATEYAPYFSRNSGVRAIAEGDANTIVDKLIKPTISSSGRALDNKAEEIALKAKSLMSDNPRLQEDVAKTFMAKGIDKAFESGVFNPKALVKYWDTYAAPRVNDNMVLKTFLRGRYKDTEDIITTLRNVKASSIDEVAENMVKTLNVSTATKAKKLDDIIQGAVKGETGVKATGQDIAATRRATKVKVTEIKKQMEADIEKLLGKAPGESGAGQFIGQLYLAEAGAHLATGNLPAAGAKAIRGTLLVMARAGFTKMMAFKRGRSLLRAAMRTTPGTVKAAAQARLIQDFANRVKNEPD